MKSLGYHAAPFHVTRWAAMVSILSALTYLLYLLFIPGKSATYQLDWSRPLDWLMFASPLALLAILAVSAFLVRFFVLMHIAAILAACSIPATFIQQNMNQQSINLDFLIIPLVIWVLMYTHAVAMRREQKRLAAAPVVSEEAASSQTSIDSDVYCVFCSYMLRGLLPGGRCPECGRPISRSLLDQPLSLYRSEWFTRVWIGALIFAISLLLRMTVDFLFEHTLTFGWHPDVANYLYFVSAVFITVGAWFVTASEKANHKYRGTGARYLVRIIAVVYALLTWFFFIEFVLGQLAWNRKIPQSWAINLPYISNRYDILESVVYVLVEWLLAFYIYLLATRMPSKRVRRHALIAGFLALTFISLNIMAPMLFDALSPNEHELLTEVLKIFLTDMPDVYLGIFLLIFSVSFPRFYRHSIQS